MEEKKMEDKILLLRVGLENRLGKRKADEFHERAVYETTNEFEILGRAAEGIEFLEQICHRLESKNDALTNSERANGGRKK